MPSSSGINRSCPNCAETIKSEAIMCRFCNRGVSTDHYLRCRFCSEMVRKTAKRCRYCKFDLEEPPQSGPERPRDGAPVPRPSSGPVGSRSAALSLPAPKSSDIVDATVSLNHIEKSKESTEQTE